ncbi:hypothetical protein ABEG17_00280 [Pedococcus sp. KACC 23699]|uniref:Uncharacterized protein n=1 Tax=Pedococcus sp. KACC 23699 TaxID=3149228 RepID=A0AAU7JUA9_9MICO
MGRFYRLGRGRPVVFPPVGPESHLRGTMAVEISVAERIFDGLYLKTVRASDGEIRDIPSGQLPEPSDELLMTIGEPSFVVRLEKEVHEDADVPDAIGFALRQVAHRLHHVMPDGREDADDEGPVEWVLGPAVHDGGVVLWLDTDGTGAARAMIDGIVKVFVEELAPLGVQAHVCAGPPYPSALVPAWISGGERQRQ